MSKKKKKYNPRKYNPALGGHAQGHIRDAFSKFIELGMNKELGLDSTLEDDENQFTLGEIIGLLWNCTDTLPRWEYDELQGWDLDFNNQTYAAAVRALKNSF